VSGHVLVDLAAVGTDLLVSFLMVAHVLLEGVHVGQLLLAQVTRDHQMGPGPQHCQVKLSHIEYDSCQRLCNLDWVKNKKKLNRDKYFKYLIYEVHTKSN
jgi:hypothetical protein